MPSQQRHHQDCKIFHSKLRTSNNVTATINQMKKGLAELRPGTSYTTKEILKPLQNNYLQGFVYLVSHSVSQTTVFSAEIYLILPGFILLNSFDFVDPVLNI